MNQSTSPMKQLRDRLPTLLDALARSQRDGSPVTLLLCDADLFKRINDQYGHAVGDAVLLYALVQGPLWRVIQERRAGGQG